MVLEGVISKIFQILECLQKNIRDGVYRLLSKLQDVEQQFFWKRSTK